MENLFTEEEKLKIEKERLKVEEEKPKTEEERLKAGEGRSEIEEEGLKIEERKSEIEEERLKIEEGKLKSEEDRLKIEEGKLKFGEDRLKIEEGKPKTGEERLKIDHGQDTNQLFGSLDANLKIIEEAYQVNILQRQDELVLKGKDPSGASEVISELLWILESGEPLDVQKVHYVISLQQEGKSYRESRVSKDVICFTYKGKPIRPKTIGQKDYAKSVRDNDIAFGVGPAGTGKTYMAVAMAINAFKNKEVEKIILARPAVEAGERLGFLPGDLQEKVDPYLRPLYDALYDILGRDSALRLKEKEAIEVVPLAYMRGRTLDHSFIILDEAQNTTQEQMKMFLTRLGFGSRAVVTGDVTQIDLPRGKKSGLLEAVSVLEGVEGIAFCFLKDTDVVRHPLVRRIINAYERYGAKHPSSDED